MHHPMRAIGLGVMWGRYGGDIVEEGGRRVYEMMNGRPAPPTPGGPIPVSNGTAWRFKEGKGADPGRNAL